MTIVTDPEGTLERLDDREPSVGRYRRRMRSACRSPGSTVRGGVDALFEAGDGRSKPVIEVASVGGLALLEGGLNVVVPFEPIGTDVIDGILEVLDEL